MLRDKILVQCEVTSWPYDKTVAISQNIGQLVLLDKYVISELKDMVRKRDYLRAMANKTGSSVLSQEYSQVRVKVNHKLYIVRRNCYTSKIEKHKYDLKNTWKVLKGAIVKAHKPLKLKRLV